MTSENYAAIDIGSNALRLLIMNIIKRDSEAKFYKNSLVRAPIRIGKEVFDRAKNSVLAKKKIISDQTKDQLIKAMKSYSLLMEVYEVKHYLAYATSAMREAENALQVIRQIEKETGIAIEIISGELEASLIFDSQLKEYVKKYETCLYMDVGGGSTELTLFHKGKKIISNSFQIGTVRILKEPIREKAYQEELQEWIKINTAPFRDIYLIATGGNINHLLKQSGQKESIEINYLEKIYQELKKLSYHQRIWNYHMKPDRADVIVPALNLYLCVMNATSAKKILVPKTGLADGMIHYLYKKYPL